MTHTHKFTYLSLPVSVEFSFTPGEKQTTNSPGCDEDYEILSIYHGGEDIMDFIETAELLENLTEEMIRDLKGEKI